MSLVPSVTETLSSWQRTPIACTRFCERPDLPYVGGTKDPNIDAIVELRPDVVVVDAEENRHEDYIALQAAGLHVLALHIQSLDDVNPAMDELARCVEAEWDPIDLGDPRSTRFRAFIPIWRRPWMALGAPTYATSLLAHLGVTNVAAAMGPYPTLSLDEARRLDPEVVLAPSEPYPFTRRQLPELEAVAPTFLVDGKDLFWWGTRTARAVERLRDVLDAC